MSELYLNSLEIKNFRCFEHLSIERLGRVNLIVGKNGVGKTALLEALWLRGSQAAWPVIQKILYDRNELVRYGSLESMGASQANPVDVQEQAEAFKSFFYGRPPINKINWVVPQLGAVPNYPVEILVFSISDARWHFSCGLRTEAILIFGWGINWDEDDKASILQNPHNRHYFPPLPQKDVLEYRVIDQSKDKKTVFIPLKGLTWQALCTYWDDIALTDKEEQIIDCLRLIDPSITRFTFKGENMQDRVRYPAVKTGRFEQPVPLAHIGEGIQRIFALALAMSTASGGFLLVDEIETGLHYQVQADMWRAVFKLAQEWDIQVFATTHSWNCIEAFQEAAAEKEDAEAMLIRLQKKKSSDGIIPVLYDKESLTIATEDNIEVR